MLVHVTSNPKIALVAVMGLWAALLPWSAAGYTLYSGEPGNEVEPHRHNIVSLDGHLRFDATAYYEWLFEVESSVDGANLLPQDMSDVSFTLFFDDLLHPAGEKSSYQLIWPEPGLGVQTDVLTRGYYQQRRARFSWLDEIGENQEKIFHSLDNKAVVVVPNSVTKIPVYRTTGLLNESSRTQNVMAEMSWLSTRLENLGTQVSILVTNIDRDLRNNHGCPAWYEFKFYGYVDTPDKDISAEEHMSMLPMGITLVDQITYCDGPVSPTSRVYGCAQTPGPRIALMDSAFQIMTNAEHIITLHEIGHSKGLGHNLDEPDYVMSEGRSPSLLKDHVGIDESECPAFSRYQEYANREPWE